MRSWAERWSGFAYPCLAGTAAVLCLPIGNPDIFWHLSAARWMAEHRAFPRTDWLSSTMAGSPWSDFEWLTELLWHAVHGAGGLPALWALKVLLLGGAAALLWRLLRLAGATLFDRSLGLFLWALSAAFANDLRPENFSLLLFLALFLRLEERRLAPPAAFRPGEAAAAAAVFALWANLHAGFLFGLVLLGVYAAGDLARRRGPALAIVLPLAAAAALVNPYGWGVYAVPARHAAELRELSRFIREWQETSLVQHWLWPFWAVFALSFAAVLRRQFRDKDLPLEHLACLLAFAVPAARHVRTAVYFVSLAVPIAAACLREPEDHGSPGRFPLPAVLRAALALAAAGFFCWNYLSPYRRFRPFLSVHVPVHAARFLEDEASVLGGRRLLNPWHWGGYLGWKLSPRTPVFVDGRYIFHGLLQPLWEANQSPEAMGSFLERYAIDVAVMPRTRQFVVMGELKRPFYLFFFPKERWGLVHFDDKALVFVRRSAVPAAWLADREYRLFRPDDLSAAYRLVLEGKASAEDAARDVRRFSARCDGDPELAGLAVAARQWLRAVSEDAPR